MLVTEFGIVTDVKPLQSQKAPSPILVTEFGISTDVKPSQKQKASSPILATGYSCPSTVIELGITTSPEYLSPPDITAAVLSEYM